MVCIMDKSREGTCKLGQWIRSDPVGVVCTQSGVEEQEVRTLARELEGADGMCDHLPCKDAAAMCLLEQSSMSSKWDGATIRDMS